MGKELDTALKHAETAFEDHSPAVDEREHGFEDDNLENADVQLRKGCRALVIARELVHDERQGLAQERHYTAAIELAFSSMERTCQGMLIASGRIEAEERPDHRVSLSRSHETGVWSEDAADRMAALYDDNRAVYYYQRGTPSRTKAAALLAVAEEAHRLAVDSQLFTGGTCICR